MQKLAIDRAAYLNTSRKAVCFTASEPGQPPVYFSVKEEILRRIAGQRCDHIPVLSLIDILLPSIHRAAQRAFDRRALVEGVYVIIATDFDDRN